MADAVGVRELCIVLSDLFIIGRIDYENIARIALKYPLNVVKDALLTKVGPVLYYEHYITTPEIYGFESAELMESVRKQIIKNRTRNPVRKLFLLIEREFIRWTVSGEWSTLYREMQSRSFYSAERLERRRRRGRTASNSAAFF